ncbi:PREDICTED: WD repeat-containing and planar cell polarity effector protein fritz homolog, partial [Apaloderma vittatum]|uniref:WD repeat-containing and planar cell polarity effector protein fritz homolog n=1 Tax=Apaloderma vittatum TaxID=57397 RepID=UPI000521632D
FLAKQFNTLISYTFQQFYNLRSSHCTFCGRKCLVAEARSLFVQPSSAPKSYHSSAISSSVILHLKLYGTKERSPPTPLAMDSVLSYVRTEWDPLDASFSTNQPYQVYTVEHSVSADKEPMADSCIYKCVRNKIQCVAVTRIPLRSKAVSCCRDVTEDKLVLGCEDSSIILYEAYNQVTLLAQAELLPALITYHPSGAIFMVGSSQGELQLFDTALSPIKIQLLAQDYSPEATMQFSKHFDVPSSLVQIQWAAPRVASASTAGMDVHDLVLVRFDKGPLGVLHFKLGVISRGQLGLVEIIHQYIRYDEIQEAINVLNTMNWNTMGRQCYICLSAIANHLLKQKLTPDREAQLEASLGTFYAPTRPLSDTTVLEYRDPISRYARRFFHHLLRYQRFEKAFLLAVDLGARDLFMDIHYLALDKGELALAEVAKKKANDIDAESITTGIGLLGQSDEENPSREAFIGQSSEDGEECDPPAPSAAIGPPAQRCSRGYFSVARDLAAYSETSSEDIVYNGVFCCLPWFYIFAPASHSKAMKSIDLHYCISNNPDTVSICISPKFLEDRL